MVEHHYQRGGGTVGLIPSRFERKRWILGHITTQPPSINPILIGPQNRIMLASCRGFVKQSTF